MRLALLLLAIGAGAAAQQTPAVEVFGGYSYYRLAGESASGLTAANLNGWNASVKWNARPRIGVLFDFGGNYGERRMLPTRFQPRETDPGTYRQHTVLFGPEVRAYAGEHFAVNVRALIGAAYEDELVLPLREPFQPPPDLLGNVQPPVTEFRLGGGKPLAGALGGSLDYRLSDRVSCRILQPDLIVTHLGGLNRKDFRVSGGIVLTL